MLLDALMKKEKPLQYFQIFFFLVQILIAKIIIATDYYMLYQTLIFQLFQLTHLAVMQNNVKMATLHVRKFTLKKLIFQGIILESVRTQICLA